MVDTARQVRRKCVGGAPRWPAQPGAESEVQPQRLLTTLTREDKHVYTVICRCEDVTSMGDAMQRIKAGLGAGQPKGTWLHRLLRHREWRSCR